MSEPKLDNLESKLALAEFDVRLLRTELDLALRRLEEARQRNTIADMQRSEIASMCGTQEGEELLASVSRVVRERDAARDEVEGLRELMRAFGSEEAMADARIDVAEQQREACAYYMIQEQDYSAQACRRTPLVTDEQP